MSSAQAGSVTFSSSGVEIAGTFAEAAAPVAAALLITGSGKIDRDSDTRRLHLRVTAEVAQALQNARVSSLRFDKRGAGFSGGDFLRAGFTENLDDARAGLTWLGAHTDALPLFAIGHSEGALHTIQLAAEGRVAGAALLGAPARSGEETLVWQARMIAPTLPGFVRGILRLFHGDIAKSQRKALARIRATHEDVVRIRGARLNARWFREFMAYDPTSDLSRITVPVLAITGGHDLQVPPDDVDAIGHLVRGEFSGHVAGDLSHLLRPDPETRGPRGYKRAVKQPVSPEVLSLITEWITAQAGKS